MTCLVLAALACAAPGVAQAHGGGTYRAGSATDPAPTVDGVVTPSEWADAKPYSVVFPSIGNATVRFVHTATDLYVGVVVTDPSPTFTPQFNVFFDSDHDGVADAGDDRWIAFADGGVEDSYYDPEAELYAADTLDEGTNDLVAAGTVSGDDKMIELRHPLCSEDAAHDICVEVGATLGVNFQYSPGPGTFVNAPGPDVLDPSNNWADLALVPGDVVEPTVSVTAPPPGALLRGTVDVAADVSDNVGVDRVEFRYHGGTLPFVDIATDRTPPYEATFDSTQVPNTVRGGGTVYAFAYDAAGNETGVGHAVMVDNPASRIVFETNRDGNSEIYIMEPNGNDGITRLTNDPAVDTRPSLSPDGSVIAWERGGDIWLMNSDGTEQRALTTGGRSGAPAFSPDGTKIAFQRDPAGDMAITYDIWVMYADGTGQTGLTSAAGNDVGATWSPDGTKLAFDSDRSGNRDIYTMNADGTSQTSVGWNSPQIDADPDWSPDGQKLLFVSGRGGGGVVVSVWSANADGSGGALNVTNATIFDADPAWSPTGDRVVFTRDSGGQTFNLHLAAADGTTTFPARITFANSTQRNSFPDWVAPAAAPAKETVTLEPVADTYVRASDPGTAHGSETTFDVYPGASTYCGRGPGPAYGLLRFDLSSLPPGVRVTSAKLDLTVDGGFASDGDPSHYAIRLNDNDWGESVTWSTRPEDGILPGPVGPPFGQPTINGTALSASQDVLGVANAFNNSCAANSGGPPVRTFAAPLDRPETFANAVSDAAADGNLSVQVWSQPCGTPTNGPCQSGGAQKGYYLRYHSREAEAAALRPKLIVTYAPGVEVDVTSFSATPTDPEAGLAQVDLDDVPPSVLLAPTRGTSSTPLGETPLGETPLGETPLGETPLGETSLGLDGLLVELRTVPLSSLPLLREGGWAELLADTPLASRALQNVSLGEVLALQPPDRPAALDEITLAQLDFSRSPLGDIASIAYALGNGVTLADLSFTNANLDPELESWCEVTGTTDCAGTGILALGLRGAPLGETPLGETPLGETPLGETPLGETPLGETPLGETPLGETPLGETAFAGTPLGETPLGETNLTRAPLGETPLGETPLGETPLGETNLNRAPLGETPLGETPLGETPLGETPLGETRISAIDPQLCTTIFVSCPPPTDTIDQHLDDLQPDVSVADLVAALTETARARLTLRDLVRSLPNPNAFSVAQLLAVLEPPSDYTIAQVAEIFTAASGVTLADLVASLPNPNAFTLNDLLLAVLRAGAQWERIDLTQPALARVATGGGTVELTADVTTSSSSLVTFTVNLARGWTAAGPAWVQTVAPGAASVLEVVDVEATATGGTRHTLRTQFPINGAYSFHFPARPGTTLGPATASLSVAAAGETAQTSPPVAFNVQETFEPNDDPASAPVLTHGNLYFSYLTSATDTDYFRVDIPAAAGTRTTIHLSHLPKDFDLVVYGPQGAEPLVEPGNAPPLETPVLADPGAPITHLTESLAAETLDDLALLPDRTVLGVSAFRTTEDEAVVAISDGSPGQYIVQVKGYNGAASVEPFVLRVEREAPRAAPECGPRFQGISFGTAPGIDLTSIPADTGTLFLANGPQLAAAGAQSVVDWFSIAHVGELRSDGFPSALVHLEDDPVVRGAYAAWNAQPCSTVAANAVVRAITDAVRTIRNARPSVRNLVLLGNDTALPFARLHDLTTIANEADYASTFGRADDLYAALYEHRVLSDDPYATTDPIPHLQRQLFVPQLAVGRLVETPAQITGALDRFLAFNGKLDPASARTSGYDFLQDGATGVAGAFADIVGAQEQTTTPPLIGNDWTTDTLDLALGDGTGLFGMNGHADHHRLQPAEGTKLFTETQLPTSLERSVIFSMGCHSGLSASDTSVAGAIAGDWAQTFAGRGAAAYAGNLGYGYGDTLTVAYSEALNVRLARGLRDGRSIGDALIEAKQGYLGNLSLVGVYDEKAMSELALYGLPMWSLDGVTAPTTPTTPALPAGVTRIATDPDPITGLFVDRYSSVQPNQPVNGNPPRLTRIDAGGGTYWTGPSGVQVTHLRPLQPKVEFDVATDAHGMLVTKLESSDLPGIDPVYARPIVDSSTAEPELPFADVAFPAKIQSLVSQQTRNGRRASAVLLHGQFFSDDTLDAAGAGHQRLFTRVDFDVLRSQCTDHQAPRLDAIEALVPPGSGIVSFSVDAVDLPAPETAGDVARVLVAFRDETSPTWRFLDLKRSGDGATWGGSDAVNGTSIEYFVQAVDKCGNVAVSTNKGLLFAGAPPVPPSGTGVTPSLTGSRTAGWFAPSATFDVEAANGVAVSVSVDGDPVTSFPFTITEDGFHRIEVRGSNGYEAALVAPVDTLPPTVALDQPGATVPLNARIPLAFRCGDTASGVATCVAKVNGTVRPEGFLVPTSPLGSTHTIELTATDRIAATNPVGHTKTETFTYTVRSRGIVYTSTETGAGDVYMLPVDAGPSTAPTRLTFTSAPEADPVWSPDSRRIAFSSNRDGTWRIYLMDADGTDVAVLPTGTGDATEPAWSPDGGRIAFVSTRSGNPDIWVVNLNGSGLLRLTTDSKLDVAPAWSSSATNRIAWSNGPGGQLDIWTMRPDGSSKTRLTRTEDLNTEAAWASNGTIAFARRAKGGNRFEIWTMTSTGGTMRRIIVSNVRNDTQPSWLQDGRLVFATDRDNERDYDLFRARPPTSGTAWPHERVTNASGDERGPNG